MSECLYVSSSEMGVGGLCERLEPGLLQHFATLLGGGFSKVRAASVAGAPLIPLCELCELCALTTCT